MTEKNEMHAGPISDDEWVAQELANARQAAIHFRERAEKAEAELAALRAAASAEPVGYGYSAEIQSAPGNHLHVSREKAGIYDTALYTHPAPVPASAPDASYDGRWLTIDVERVLDVDRGRDVILSDRSRQLAPHTIMVLLSDISLAKLRDDYAASAPDAEIVAALEENCWDLRCIDVPTGGGDADVSWNVVEHHMAPPKERIVGFGKSPREAIIAALAKAKGVRS